MRRSPRIGQQHRDWIILLDREGPFLSYPVLADVFPQGLDNLETDLYRSAKEAYSLWQERSALPDEHSAWIRFVLERVLGYQPELLSAGQSIPSGLSIRVQGAGETLRPDIVLHDPRPDSGPGAPQADAPRLLLAIYPATQRLDRPVSGGNRSPIARMQELLLSLNVNRGSGAQLSLGLVSNGRFWALVYAPKGEAGSTAVWDAYAWADERASLQSFIALLGQARLSGVVDIDSLESLFARSAASQQDVTDQLGRQVRRAVEVLVGTLDRIDANRERELLAGLEPGEVYNAALTVMMRLVFMFSAEENGLLLLGSELYDSNYSVTLLRAQLNEEADRVTEEVLGNRTDAWARLLAAFRLIFAGAQHPDLNIPPYGGRLFDPDRYPFLEGRPAGSHWREHSTTRTLEVDNRTVLHLLRALQELEIPGRQGEEAQTQLLSFKGLDIEQIGHVYEGLLDHTARRAGEPILGLSGKHEPEIALSRLEELRAKGSQALLEFLKERTGRTPNAIEKALANPVNLFAHKLGTRCGNDIELVARIAPFAALLREDTLGYPVVILPGAVYVTQGSLRRSTGTHYTPRTLTEPIVKHTLEPLVYHGLAEGLPAEQWALRTPRELLALRVCDMAMGSGAFLVQACRYLSERLVESWQAAASTQPKDEPLCLPFAEPYTDPQTERAYPRADTPIDAEECSILARRLIAERCLYGVDLNPMAVEMAKLSLWLITMSKGRPFSFLDHAFKCGDSLLGVGADNIRSWSLDGKGRGLEGYVIQKEIDLAIDLRRRLEAIPGETLDAVREKERLNHEAEALTARLKLAGDLVLAPYIGIDKPKERVNAANELSSRFIAFTPSRIDTFVHSRADEGLAQEDAELRARATELLGYSNNEGQHKTHRPFHWELEFPEVFLQGEKRGFDAFVGNPPFMLGKSMSSLFGAAYREFLVESVASRARGNADLVTYFFLRAGSMIATGGALGLIATNSIAQGDSRLVGLRQMVGAGFDIYRAFPTRKWPGTASIEVAIVWMIKAAWHGQHLLCTDSEEVKASAIDSHLSGSTRVAGDPYQLVFNNERAFLGSLVNGAGFLISKQESDSLISANGSNVLVIKDYYKGEDLTTRFDQSASIRVIDFSDWPLSRKEGTPWKLMEEPARKKCLSDGIVPLDYPGRVAADFPECLNVILERVKPQRDKLQSGDASARTYAKYWWRFGRSARQLYKSMKTLSNVLARARTANLHSVIKLPSGAVYNENTVVFVGPPFFILQSSIHEIWARTYSQTIRSDMQYSPTKAFETYPFPATTEEVTELGERYYQHRQSIMLARQEGLTATYNRFHRPDEQSADIVELRRLHVEMDEAVARAYGWTAEQGQAIELGHGFHETKQGLRYTISPAARQEVLDRLLALNITRYAEEVAQGLHNNDKKLTPDAINTLCERLQSLDRADLIEAVKTRPTGKSATRKSQPRQRVKSRVTDDLF